MRFGYLSHNYAQKPPINAHADISSEVTCLTFGLSLHLHPYFLYASREGLPKSEHLCNSPEPALLNNDIHTMYQNCMCGS